MKDLAREINDYLDWLMGQGVELCYLGDNWPAVLDSKQAERFLKNWLAEREKP